ncbi:MAG: hypothetical protein AAFV19_12005 [Pseudomonadota bacterium]
MEPILELLFGSPWQLVVAMGIYGLLASTYKDLWKHDVARKRWTGYLIQNTWSRRYKDLLGHILNWIDVRLTPEIEDHGWQPGEVRSAWSFCLFNFSFAMAWTYPVIAIVAMWLIGGEPQRLGSSVILSGDVGQLARAAELAVVIAYVALILWLATRPPVDIAKAVIFGTIGGFPYLLVVYATRGFSAESSGFTFTAFAWAGGMIFMVSYLGNRWFQVAYKTLGGMMRRKTLFLISVYVALLCVVVVTTAIPAPEPYIPQTPEEAAALAAFDQSAVGQFFLRVDAYMIASNAGFLLFASALPIFNALTDFLSSGLTRYLMRRGLERRMLFAAGLDVLGAAAAFVSMGFGLMVVLAIARDAYGQPIFDLSSIFANIRADPGAYWWLYICLMSTLVPTLAHLALAAFGVVIQGWPGLRRYIVQGLEAAGHGDEVQGRWATRALTIAMTLSIMLPILIVGALLEHQGAIALMLLAMFEGLARIAGLI